MNVRQDFEAAIGKTIYDLNRAEAIAALAATLGQLQTVSDQLDLRAAIKAEQASRITPFNGGAHE